MGEEHRQDGMGYIIKLADEAMVSKPVSSGYFPSFCFSSCLQVPALSSCLGFPSLK